MLAASSYAWLKLLRIHNRGLGECWTLSWAVAACGMSADSILQQQADKSWYLYPERLPKTCLDLSCRFSPAAILESWTSCTAFPRIGKSIYSCSSSVSPTHKSPLLEYGERQSNDCCSHGPWTHFSITPNFTRVCQFLDPHSHIHAILTRNISQENSCWLRI